MSSMMRDLRFAWRLTVRQPVLTVTAALTVAFGVGANTAILSMLETVLLNPLGLRHTDRVLVPTIRIDKLKMYGAAASAVEFRDIHAMSDAFSAVAATEDRAWTSEIGGEANRVLGEAVTAEFFSIFDQRPILHGRRPGGSRPLGRFLAHRVRCRCASARPRSHPGRQTVSNYRSRAVRLSISCHRSSLDSVGSFS